MSPVKARYCGAAAPRQSTVAAGPLGHEDSRRRLATDGDRGGQPRRAPQHSASHSVDASSKPSAASRIEYILPSLLTR